MAVHGVLTVEQRLERDLEVDSATGHHVLHLEVFQLDSLGRHALHLLGVMSSSLLAELLTLGACDDHLAVLEDEGRCACRLLDTHDQCSKTSWIVLSVTTAVADLLQIEFLIQVGSGNQILNARLLMSGHLSVTIVRVGRRCSHVRRH